MTMKPILRAALAIAVAVLALARSASPASAHASLVRATPGINESLESSPVLIELYFSEPVEGTFSLIQVLDSAGRQVDNADSTVDPANPTRLTVTVRSLSDGVYTVVWKALSLVDSHITGGAYPFSVGDVDAAALAAAAAASEQVNLSFGEVLFRWLSYISGSVLAGSVLFILFVWNPARRIAFMGREEPTISVPWRPIAQAALIVMAIANILGLLFQAGQVAGQEIAAPWNEVTARLLFTTRYGVLWLIRFTMLLVIARFLPHASRPRDYWIAFAACLVILFTFSYNSHAAAEPRPFFPIAADWLHLLASSFWLGGLISLTGGLVATRRLDAGLRARLIAVLIPRFSGLALASVGLLGVTGLYSAVLRLGSFDALTTTFYGRLLLVKTLLASPAFALGAVNLLTTTPAMKKAAQEGGDQALAERFGMLVRGEIVFLSLVLIAVGVFTAVPPARAAATESTLTVRSQADDLSVQLEISPGTIGLNDFLVEITTESGEPLVGAREVALQFAPTTAELPPSETVLEEVGDGLYRASGAYLSLPDEWQLQVAVRREGVFDVFASFVLPVGVTATQRIPSNQISAGLLLLAAVLHTLALRKMAPPEGRRAFLSRIPAAALLVVAVVVFNMPVGVEERYINPIPPNQSSVAAGQAIYRVQCISCHGPGGRGDGPVGLTLNPPPADLYLHTQPGVHPDGRLFEWISFGFADNQIMPRFESILTEEERWHVVNYIRTFSQPLEEDDS